MYPNNGQFHSGANFTKEWARVNMDISAGYGEDLDHVIEVINRVGKELAEDPHWTSHITQAPHVLRVDAFEDSGIAIKILGATESLSQWNVMGELRLRLKKAFDEEGIEIPWPHTKVFLVMPLVKSVSRSLSNQRRRRHHPQYHQANVRGPETWYRKKEAKASNRIRLYSRQSSITRRPRARSPSYFPVLMAMSASKSP